MSVFGIEPSVGYAGYARDVAGLEVATGSFPTSQGPLRSYDIVAMFHVLEHLPRPVEILVSIREMLSPSGVLILEVPDIERAVGFQWSERYFHRPHLFDFTLSSLEYLLKRAGFVIRTAKYRRRDRKTRHHLLVTAKIGAPSLLEYPATRQSRRSLRKLQRWIKISRISRPVYLLFRSVLENRSER